MTDFGKFGLKACSGGQGFWRKKLKVGEAQPSRLSIFFPKPPTFGAGFETKISKVRHLRAVFTLKVDVFIFVNGVPQNAKAGLDIQRVGNYRVVSSFNSPSGVWTLQKGQLKTKPWICIHRIDCMRYNLEVDFVNCAIPTLHFESMSSCLERKWMHLSDVPALSIWGLGKGAKIVKQWFFFAFYSAPFCSFWSFQNFSRSPNNVDKKPNSSRWSLWCHIDPRELDPLLGNWKSPKCLAVQAPLQSKVLYYLQWNALSTLRLTTIETMFW